MFDAYTVKKVLPRLVAAVILIQLSWFILTGAITLVTAVSYGIEGLMVAPFGGMEAVSLPNIFSEVAGLGSASAAGGLALVGIAGTIAAGGLGALALMIALALVVGFFVLVMRKALLVALLILSPLAFVAWILPGTERFWKMWWDNFSKLLLMFPLIIVILTTGRIFAYIFATQPEAGAGAIDAAIILISVFVPFFLIPMTYKMAGAGLGAIAGAVKKYPDQWTGMAREAGRNRQKKKLSEGAHRATAGNFFKGGDEHNLRGRLNRGIGTAAHVGAAGVNPTKWKSRVQASQSESGFDHAMEALEKNSAMRAVKDNDTLLNASMHKRGTEADIREYLQSNEGGNMSGRDLEQNVAAIMRAKREVGDHAFRIGAAVANAGTGTGYGTGAGEMLSALNDAAGGDTAMAGRMLAVARSNASNARRFDLAGAGFGDSIGQLSNIARHSGNDEEKAAAITHANGFLAEKAIDAQGAGAALGGRGQSVRNLAPAMRNRITRAVRAVAEAAPGAEQESAERTLKQTLASTAGLLDTAASVSPENARILADEVMNYVPPSPGGGVENVDTVGSIIEQFRGDNEFGEMRREYGQQAYAQHANAAAAAAAATQQGNLPNPIQPPPGVPEA